ncbi:RecQ family ATP-dependent DNA helicase [Christiangramia forsetii]|uniref:ATP-dependent DNA helicase RecQ n=2 Tax=Christiangramia forsetii TaxID=411153 RepID=A0M1C3_CHRFK|nr:ATP-dependent DNA helicase RecQ [Christiangramia forsetii]GGG42876.1 ATP-dependent DNA helicase RecQ2 [Christiangramia forsetii]CAL66418.1 RecQ-like DEAD box helicase family protein [Christiangramia forsetii KT0803]
MQKEALKILEKYWGFQGFRSQQLKVIESILQERDTLTLFPTGGGKSICFQVPSLLQEGICVVVSPLISLMEDQVNALQQKNIKAMAITGGISYADLDRNLDNCIFGNYKFLYLSPERLQQELVRERLKQMNINLIAVDEAHCISQWGHDFRPAYRNIADIRDLLPEVQIAAFTATATEDVVKDICEQLHLKDPVIHQKSFERSNLQYEVIKTEDKFFRLTQILNQKSAIIYVRSRNATQEISGFLNKNGITAAAYHGGLKKEEKSDKFEKWLTNKISVMVATTAFGMGIDKPDVRTVIHIDLPESMESYFQEAGRAGRDSQPAKAIILTNAGDVPVLKNQFLNNLASVEDIKLVYRKLNAYFRIAFGEGENTEYDFNFSSFCNQYHFNSHKTFNALQLLDRCSILRLSQNYQKKTEIRILISGNHLDNYLDENPRYANIMRTILRNYGGVFENLIPFNLASVSEKSNISEKECIKIFDELDEKKIIEFNLSKHDASITYLQPREDDATINPVSGFINEYNSTKKAKIEAVLDFVQNDQVCRQIQLLKYFGEKSPKPCGKCSVCNKKDEKLSRDDMNEIYLSILRFLKNGPRNSREIVEHLKYSENAIIKILGLLCEKGVLDRTVNNKYKILNK